MRALLDMNMILALFDPKHIFHARARAWWIREHEHGWATCPITENGFLRVATQKAYANPIRLPDAIAILRRWAQPPQHALWPDDVSLLDARVIDHAHVLGHRQLTDVYLLALATRRQGRFVTLDRGLSLAAVHGATAANLVVV